MLYYSKEYFYYKSNFRLLKNLKIKKAQGQYAHWEVIGQTGFRHQINGLLHGKRFFDGIHKII